MVMVPGETFVRETRRPYITYLLIAINTIIYLATSYNNFFLSTSQRYVWRYSFIPVYLDSAEGWIRIFTSMFLHADILHIFFNMYFLYVFGKVVESYLGSGKYLIMYLFSGFIAAMVHSAMSFFLGVENLGIPALGASGAISGVLGSFLIMFPGTRLSLCFFFFIIPLCGVVSSSFFIIFWFALQVIYGYLQLGGVAFFAHVGGFLAGILATVIIARDLQEKYLFEGFSQWLYQTFSISIPWLTPRPRGLSSLARVVLVLLILLVVIGEAISGYSAAVSGYNIYYLNFRANLTQSSGAYSSEAVVILLNKQNTSSYLAAPIIDDVIRVLFNRLFYAGYIVNTSLSGYSGEIFFNGYIRIPDLRAPPVQLILSMNASYNSEGVLIKGSGNAVTDLLTCSGGVCEIASGSKWVYNSFSINGSGPVSINDIIYLPILLSIVVSLATLLILLSRIDREVSLT